MNRKSVYLSLLALAVLVVLPALAQEGEMTPEQMAEMEAYMAAGTPGAPHAALAATAGKYTAAVKSWQDPAAPPMESTGTVTRKMMFDGRVRVEEFAGSMMGMPFTGQGMIGFDNVSGKYWSTWLDSMSTGIATSTGSCDDKNACTFIGSWNDPISGKPITSRMTTHWSSPTTEVFEMYGPGRDGKEMKMMEMTYTKQN